MSVETPAPALFRRAFRARWGDMDFNGHMRNTAYLDVCGDVRMMYFEEHGFPMLRFEELRFGPVITRDELEYFRELRLLEPLDVTLVLAGLAPGAARFKLRNEFWNGAGKLVARVTSTGGWLDLGARRLAPPPPELASVIETIVKSDDFVALPERP